MEDSERTRNHLETRNLILQLEDPFLGMTRPRVKVQAEMRDLVLLLRDSELGGMQVLLQLDPSIMPQEGQGAGACLGSRLVKVELWVLQLGRTERSSLTRSAEVCS